MNIYPYLRNALLILIIIQIIPGVISMLQDQYGILTMGPKVRVGKVDISGTITDAHTYIKQLKELFDKDNIDAIMLAIDSGGGSAGSAQTLFNDIKALKKKHNKPVITWVENTCASGAYYTAAASDYIITSPSAFVGSIGVYIPQVQLKQFIEQFKIGYDIVQTGKYKGITDPFLERSEKDKQLLQGITDDVYQIFTQDIAAERSALAERDREEWANGKLFTGHQAQELNMIDATGSLTSAEEQIRSLTDKTGDIEYITPKQSQTLAQMLSQTAVSAGSQALNLLQHIQA